MTKVVIKVTRRDADGSGYAELFAGGITISNEKVFYTEAEATAIKKTLQHNEPGIIVEIVQ